MPRRSFVARSPIGCMLLPASHATPPPCPPAAGIGAWAGRPATWRGAGWPGQASRPAPLCPHPGSRGMCFLFFFYMENIFLAIFFLVKKKSQNRISFVFLKNWGLKSDFFWFKKKNNPSGRVKKKFHTPLGGGLAQAGRSGGSPELPPVRHPWRAGGGGFPVVLQ